MRSRLRAFRKHSVAEGLARSDRLNPAAPTARLWDAAVPQADRPYDRYVRRNCNSERSTASCHSFHLFFWQCLIRMYKMCILVHMRSTLNIDDEMLRKAAELTGEKEKTALVRMGLEALIARESARRLARLGGTEPNLPPTRRRRPRPAK